MKLIVTVVFLFFAGYVLLAYGMDTSYDAGTNQSSVSVAEAHERKTLVTQLIPDKEGFSISKNKGKIKEVWIEKNWGYEPHGLVDRILNVHPTIIMPGRALVITFEGDRLIKSHLIQWEFSLKTDGGERFGGGSQSISLDERMPIPNKLYVRKRLRSYNSRLVTVDSVALRP